MRAAAWTVAPRLRSTGQEGRLMGPLTEKVRRPAPFRTVASTRRICASMATTRRCVVPLRLYGDVAGLQSGLLGRRALYLRRSRESLLLRNRWRAPVGLCLVTRASSAI